MPSAATTERNDQGAVNSKATVVEAKSSVSSNSGVWSEPKLIIEPSGEPINLLRLFDRQRDVAAGNWNQATSGALIGEKRSVLHFPAKLPQDYQLKYSIRRIEGNDTLNLGFMMSGRPGMLTLDGWNASAGGLAVDLREANNNATTWHGGLFRDSLAQVVLTVHPGHLHATFDGKNIADWHGNPDRLCLHYGHITRESPFVSTSEAKYVIESASLIPIKPQPTRPRPSRVEHDIDVVTLMDLERDQLKGIWAINKKSLYSPDGFGLMALPIVVPQEYTLSFTVELPVESRGNPVIGIGLPVGNDITQIVIKNDDCLGLDTIDGYRWNENATRLSGGYLVPGIPMRIDCTVTSGRIRMEMDGRTMIDWQGDFRRLSVPSDWIPADARRFYLGAMTHFRFRDIKLIAPVPPPNPASHPPITLEKGLDLLSVVDPVRDARAGKWTKEDKSLRTLADVEWPRLTIPVDVPKEYVLTMRVAREPGGPLENDAIILGLPAGPSKAEIVIDGNGSQFTGLRLGRTDWNQNSTLHKGTVIPSGPAVDIVVEVRSTGIKVTSKESTIIDWTGNLDNLTSLVDRGGPERRISLATFKTRFRIEKLDIQALPETSLPPAKSLGDDGKVLPVIDVVRDSRLGEWSLETEGLLSPNIELSRLQIPVPAPSRYILTADVERKQGRDDLYLGLVVGGQPCLISIDGSPGGVRWTGIDMLDSRRFYDPQNATARTYRESLLPVNTETRVRCVVLPDTIVVTCGDKEILCWHGDSRRLSLGRDFIPPNYSESDRTRLWLGAWKPQFIIRDLTLEPVTDFEAEELTRRFTGVSPIAPQANVPFATATLSGIPNTSNPPSASPTKTELRPQQLPPAKPGEWVDLLEWAEGVDWSSRGINWNKNIDGKATRSGIRLRNAEGMRFPLPAIIDGDYELDVEFTRYQGQSDATIHFPIGNHIMRLLFSADRGEESRIEFVDGKPGGSRRPGSFSNNQSHRIQIRVRKDGEKAAYHIDFDDNKDYFKWEGATSSLTNKDRSIFRTTMIRHVWVGSHISDIEFHKVRIKMLSGTIERDVITDADREQDLKDGFVRLVGEPARAVKTAREQFTVNQFPLPWAPRSELRWPMVTRDPKACDDFYGAHASSRIKCQIPARAKSFSVVGVNEGSRQAKYQILIDGEQVYDSGETGTAIIKVDIPPKASLLELMTDPAGENNFDHTYWCFPRFHPMAADLVADKMIDGKSGYLKFTPTSGKAEYGGMTHNQHLSVTRSPPVHFRDALPCDEFLFAHAPATVTYVVPEGMHHFTAVGYNSMSHHVKFEVWADAKLVYESPQSGIIPIDVKLPSGTKTIELKTRDLGDAQNDVSMWCYPRLYRK